MPDIRELESINTWIDEGVGVIQINLPAKRNTLTWQVHFDMLKVLEEYKDDKSVACILLWGNEKFFSSGWEITLLEKTSFCVGNYLR